MGRALPLLGALVAAFLLHSAHADIGGGPVPPGDPDYWIKLKSLKISEGKLQPPFSPSETEYVVNITNPGAQRLTVIPELDVTKYNLIDVPKISVNGNETHYSPLGAIQLKFNLSDNGDFAPLDKTIDLRLSDPSGGFETQEKTYHLHLKQPPNFEKVVSATDLAVYDVDGVELPMKPAFNKEMPHNEYTLMLEAETDSVDVLLSCQDAATSIVYEGRPKTSGERYNVELPGVRKSLMAACEYNDPVYTRNQPLQRAYILKFIKDQRVGDLEVSITMLSGDDGFCQQKNLTNWEDGWNCETPAQSANVIAFFDEKKAELDLIDRTTGVKYVLQNGLPTSVPAPLTGRDQYDVELVAGTHHKTYELTLGNFTWLRSHGLSAEHTTTTTTTTWVPLEPGTYFFHAPMNVSEDPNVARSDDTFESVGSVKRGGEVEVVELKTFPGHVEWGRIKDPAGWILLSNGSFDEDLATKKLPLGVYAAGIPMGVSAHARPGNSSNHSASGSPSSGGNVSSKGGKGHTQTIPQGARINIVEIRVFPGGLQRGRIEKPCAGWVTLADSRSGGIFAEHKAEAPELPPLSLDSMKITVSVPETDGECRGWHHAGSYFCRNSVPSTVAEIQYAFAVYGPGTEILGRQHSQSLELKAPIQGVHRYRVVIHDATGSKATLNIYCAQEVMPGFQTPDIRRLIGVPKSKQPEITLQRSALDLSVLLVTLASLASLGVARWRKHASTRFPVGQRDGSPPAKAVEGLFRSCQGSSVQASQCQV